MEKYPVFTLEVDKNETSYKDVDAVMDYLKEKIDTHPVAVYIGEFDHYAHTKSLADGEVSEDINCLLYTSPSPRDS